MSDERRIPLDKIWARVRGRLRQEFGESTYRSWLKSLVLEKVVGQQAIIIAPNLFMRDRIISHYGDRISMAWVVESEKVITDCLIIVQSLTGSVEASPSEDLQIPYEQIVNIKTVTPKSKDENLLGCLLYTSPSPRDLSTSRMPSSA